MGVIRWVVSLPRWGHDPQTAIGDGGDGWGESGGSCPLRGGVTTHSITPRLRKRPLKMGSRPPGRGSQLERFGEGSK